MNWVLVAFGARKKYVSHTGKITCPGIPRLMSIRSAALLHNNALRTVVLGGTADFFQGAVRCVAPECYLSTFDRCFFSQARP